jgi:hypothetical protein
MVWCRVLSVQEMVGNLVAFDIARFECPGLRFKGLGIKEREGVLPGEDALLRGLDLAEGHLVVQVNRETLPHEGSLGLVGEQESLVLASLSFIITCHIPSVTTSVESQRFSPHTNKQDHETEFSSVQPQSFYSARSLCIPTRICMLHMSISFNNALHLASSLLLPFLLPQSLASCSPPHEQ